MPHHYSPELRAIQNGRYEIIGKIGSGGSSVVYKARDTFLDKVVAIKKLHKTASDEATLRFQREAKVAGSLTHPNIQGVLDFGLIDDCEPYLVLDFVAGETLAQRLQGKGPLETIPALDVLIQVARGLAYAHSKNVVHRDIKPSNIMLVGNRSQESSVLILDFGLAKSVSGEQDLTQPGSVHQGTTVYMAPEMIRGESADVRSDVYSFGCVAFELFTGVPPFSSENALTIANQHLNDPAPQMSKFTRRSINNDLQAIIYRCLDKTPGNRFADGNSILEALIRIDELIGASLAENKKQTQSKRTVFTTMMALRPTKVQAKPIAIIGGIVLAIAGLTSFLIFNELSETQTKETPQGGNGNADNFVESQTRGKFIAAGANDEDLKALLQQHQPVRLDLSNSTITPAGLQLLKNVPIRSIVMENRAVTNEMLHSLSEIHSLEELHFSQENDESFDLKGLKHLTALKNLRTLELQHMKMDRGAWQDISRLKDLTWLDFQYGEGLNIHIFDYLNELKHLKGFDVKYSDLSDESFKGIDLNNEFEEMDLELTNISDAILSDFAKLKQLKKLALSHAEGITSAGIANFRKVRPNIKVSFDEF